MKIVFVVNGYYPNYSTNGICVNKIVQSLKNEHEVHVLCKQDGFGLKQNEIVDSINVHRFCTKEISLRNRLSKKIKENKGFKKWLAIFASFFVKGWFYVKPLFQKHTVKKELVVSIESAIKAIADIDILVPCCFPFESLIAAYNVKKERPNIFVEPLLFDKFADNVACQKNVLNMVVKKRNHIKLQQTIFSDCDSIVATYDWKNYLSSTHSNIIGKTCFIEIPSLTNYRNEGPAGDYFIYCGLINKKIRPVSKILSILGGDLFKNYKFVFFVKGSQAKQVRHFSDKNSAFHCEVNVPFEKCSNEIQRSRGLISIGNLDVSQTPSKIFEYISSGKPIVHFYYDKNDRCISLLERYGNGYCFNVLDYGIKDLIELKRFFDSSHSVQFNEQLYAKFMEADPVFAGKVIVDNKRRLK